MFAQQNSDLGGKESHDFLINRLEGGVAVKVGLLVACLQNAEDIRPCFVKHRSG
jgi:hypothetical protein